MKRQEMSDNSQLSSLGDVGRHDCGFTDPVMLSEGDVSRLYRVSRAGRYFIIKTAADGSGRLKSLIRREYDISLSLDHPYIIKVFTYEEESIVGPGLVMEYVDGRTLGEFLREDPPLSLRKRVMGQILDAVGYLHRKGVIHNDLKPDNILITNADNDVRIIDFGLSDNDAYFLVKTLGCTPRYASPELLGREPLDSRSDIYSLGLLMKQVFGRRYGHIWQRCIRPQRERRYDNVDQISRALSLRIYPLVLGAVSAVFAIFLCIRLCEVEDFYKEEQSIVTLTDSLKKVTRERVDSIFVQLTKTIETIPYREFAYIEMGRATENIDDLWRSFPEEADKGALLMDFQQVFNENIERVLLIIEEKSPLEREGLSDEEFRHYYSLYIDQQPYRPFVK